MSLVLTDNPTPPLAAVGVSAVSPTDLDTLARTVWGEARGEALIGQAAVAWVVVNRVIAGRKDKGKFGWWGDTVHDVCLAHAQFSCWLKTDPNFQGLASAHRDAAYPRAHGIAALVLAGDVPDPTHGATHYFAVAIPPPAWTVVIQPLARIGAHAFFREPSWS